MSDTEDQFVGPANLSDAQLKAISRSGWGLFLIWAATLVIWGIIQPEPYAEGWRLVLWLAFTGRLTNVADGIASGFSLRYLFIQSGLQDIVLLLIVYPVVVRAYQETSKTGLIARYIEQVRRAAERNKAIVEPFGAIGLWIFVFFPFWSTGALVGGVVGYLLGLRTFIVFASVLSGHFLSVVSLIWFFEVTYDFALRLNQGAGRFFPWFVLTFVILVALSTRLYRRHRNRRAVSDRTGPGDAP